MIVAVHYQTGAWITPRPNTIERDRDGHHNGCAYRPWGCSVTRCRETLTAELAAECAEKVFVWREF